MGESVSLVDFGLTRIKGGNESLSRPSPLCLLIASVIVGYTPGNLLKYNPSYH
ncbi:uncharacterized protein G2W53_021665 [Senna tora]|uniref:Uncharacterized protein n=1 Tax=Senna tora TaxID=362788 RepID=A0A834WLC0_9FABA|nr:uncharacterized protein G2W53_021665 [Senna tora]